ncbi:hypothetical protein K440DRAFT_662840 [Wilcoxina mikolae CBS 423.85]|nr:hypothetical protein K440DRAFT_662840 [Wilcoxina mikolae CBS 423.85]
MRLYDLDVQLMTQNHDPLPEYGFTRRNSRGIASVYVPSITNISFYIRIEARPQHLNLSKFDWEQLSVAVYVDKEDEDNQSARDSAVMITRSSNCTELRGRKAMLPDGTTVEQKWVFLEMGIESRFDALLSLGDGLKHKSGGAGKITVQVHRCFSDTKGGNQKLSYKEEAILVRRDNPDNMPYATMSFFYRGIPQLQKMGFLNETTFDMSNPMDQIVAGICEMNLGAELGTSHEFAKPTEGVQPILPLVQAAKRPLQLEGDEHQSNSCRALQKVAR